jgi:alpha-tubulin suppressor-like RCC1 family protein
MNLRCTFSSLADHSVFLAANGKLYSWGSNVRLCLGQGETKGSVNEPGEMNAPELYDDGGFKDFAAGEHHNLLLTNKSRIFTWGRNEDGQLGLGHYEDVLIPTLITNFPDSQIPARVHCGAHFSAVLTEDGSVYTMGYNNNGQLGNHSYKKRSTPKKVKIPTPVIELACGWSFVMALTESKQIFGWGFNGTQHSDGLPGEYLLPTLLPSLTGFIHLQAGPNHVLGIHEDGALITWGDNSGDDTQDHKPRPIISHGCQDIACGYYTSLALMDDSALLSWGQNSYGKLGIGSSEEVEYCPKEVRRFRDSPKEDGKLQIACFGCSAEHSFFLSEGGELYLWGCGDTGELGMGEDKSSKSVPTLLQNWKWELPKDHIWAKWKNVFQWLFLGRLDEDSCFNKLYVEIIFNFLTVY